MHHYTHKEKKTITYKKKNIKKNMALFIVFLKQFVVIAHLSSFGKLFHRSAAPVSIRRLPYRTYLYLFRIIDVVLADLKGRFGWYQFSKSDM